jgi:hypothetical protein
MSTIRYTNDPTKRDPTVDALNQLLIGELSAIESYDRALPAVEDKAELRRDLQDCRASHERRVALIRNAILEAGGEPVQASGPWGVFAKAVADGARALGWKAVITTLEEGEEHGLADYDRELPRLDEATRALVWTELYPEQRHTHDVLAALKRGATA